MLYALTGFMFILFLAMLNSVNPTRSLWSNFERMEGLVTMLYMAVLFIISASTIRLREWNYLMNASIIVSTIVGINALSGEDRISGHLGNSSYLGVYALIHIFFGLLGAAMIFRGNREAELQDAGEHKTAHKLNTNNWISITLYISIAVFNAFILFKTGTRGAFVGLVVGLVLSSIYLAWKEKNKIIRFGAIGFLTAIVVSVGFLGIFKQSAIVKNSNQLNRFAQLVTTDYRSVLENQGEARTMIWSMAYEGFKEKPILGWGQDNFGYVFAKHYNPGMYDQEQWFDRSHNVFMDWLTAAGVLGLLGYLSLFVIALYFIFSKKASFTIIERSVWLGLLASYFIHNIFVFDNLSSYVLFFLILAYINDRYTHDRNEKVEHKNITEEDKNKFILLGIISLFIISYIGYQTILKPYTQNTKLIGILKDLQVKGVTNNFDKDFKAVLDLGGTGKFEGFEQLSTLLPKILLQENISTTTKQNVSMLYKGLVDEYDKEKNQDARYNYFVSNTYRSLGMKDQALVYSDRAYELSPKKQSFAYNKALILMNTGDLNGTLVLLKKAYEDAPQNLTAYGYYIGVLSEVAKKNNYDATSVNIISQELVDGYKTQNYDLIFKADFWGMFTDKRAKIIIGNKIVELLPEKKVEILEASK
jgi:O-antigen ligase